MLRVRLHFRHKWDGKNKGEFDTRFSAYNLGVWFKRGKVVSRNKKGQQSKKKIYESDSKFETYSKDLIYRWQEHDDIEVYKLDGDEKWILQYSVKMPRTREQWKQMQIDRNYRDWWFESKCKDLSLDDKIKLIQEELSKNN